MIDSVHGSIVGVWWILLEFRVVRRQTWDMHSTSRNERLAGKSTAGVTGIPWDERGKYMWELGNA